MPVLDRVGFGAKLTELERLAKPLSQVEAQMDELNRSWPEAQRLDAVRGITVVAAVAIAGADRSSVPVTPKR